MTFRTSKATAVLAAVVLTATPVAAQKPSAGDATNAPAARELVVTKTKIAAFVDAAITVERLGASWKPKVDAAKSEAEATKLVQSAHREMRRAVQDTPGISLEEYAAIATAAQKDPKLGEEIKSRLLAARNSKD